MSHTEPKIEVSSLLLFYPNVNYYPHFVSALFSQSNAVVVVMYVHNMHKISVKFSDSSKKRENRRRDTSNQPHCLLVSIKLFFSTFVQLCL